MIENEISKKIIGCAIEVPQRSRTSRKLSDFRGEVPLLLCVTSWYILYMHWIRLLHKGTTEKTQRFTEKNGIKRIINKCQRIKMGISPN